MTAKPKVSSNPFYGIIGNGETCALVGPTGDVDWFCIPRFDSPFVFGRLVDSQSGFFEVKPRGGSEVEWEQRYRPDTAILETACRRADGAGVFRVTDWMPRGKRELRRLLTPERDRVEVDVHIRPTFDYRRAVHTWAHHEEEIGGARFAHFAAETDGQSLHLFLPAAAVAPESDGIEDEGVGAGLRLILHLTAPTELLLIYADAAGPHPPDTNTAAALEREESFWSAWLQKATYRGAYVEEFHRSLITMKLLTYDATGAILAAGTSSLPQRPGIGANWDYRFAWVRDGAYTASAYVEAGCPEEAKAFVDFLFSVMNTDGRKPWQPLYRIDGNPDCAEEELEHLAGFLGDYPVRIGNLAYIQKQNDAEGEVIEALWDVYERTRDEAFLKKHWEKVRIAAQWVIDHWTETDNGIWELREVTGHYTHSKVLCWTALHRAARIADALGHWSLGDLWRETAGAIRAEVLHRGWNSRMRSFTLAYDMPLADTCMLALPLSGMLEPNHPKVRRMVERFEKELVYDHLVARNIFEPLPFVLVTYWLARYYLLANKPEKARAIVDRTIVTMTDLKLFCEHAISAEDVPGPKFNVLLKSALDLLTAHNSFEAFGNFVKSLYNYYTKRNPSSKKTRKPHITREQLRLFKGNFPQVYSHEELVRVLVRLGV